ncbi:MAG: hypothetical protein WB780_16055 [Candidatus Acidiferrales bacterium]
MKTIRNTAIALALMLASVPVISAQDLSRYRTFSLGTSLAALTKQVGQNGDQATLIHRNPAVIQQLTHWPMDTSSSPVAADPVSQIVFSFYNGELYKISVIYDERATEGITEDDMVQTISARYGTAIRLYPEINLPTYADYSQRDKVIARWIDSENSVSLIRSSTLDSYGLVVVSRRLDAQATAAIIESARLDKEEAPQKEIDRQKKEVADLELTREKNKKTLRP